MNQPRVILLDFDDTLILSAQFNVYGWQKSAVEVGLPSKDVSVWRERWGGKPTDLVRKVYDFTVSEEKAKEVLRIQQERIAREKSVVPCVLGGPEALDELAKKYVLGIVTSREHARTSDTAKYRARDGTPLFSLLDYRIDSSGYNVSDFTILVGSDENPHHKPDPRVFEKPFVLLAEKGIVTNGALYVGDDISDWLAARDAGLRFVGVLTGVKTKEQFLEAGCPKERIIESIAQLPAYLRL